MPKPNSFSEDLVILFFSQQSKISLTLGNMFVVYIFQNKKTRNIQIGFSENLNDSKKYLETKFGVKFNLIKQEKYKSKKDAMIRVKQLKNKF